MLVRQTISLNTAGKQQPNTNNKERWKSGAYNISVRHRVLLIVLKCHMVFLYPQHGLLILKSPPPPLLCFSLNYLWSSHNPSASLTKMLRSEGFTFGIRFWNSQEEPREQPGTGKMHNTADIAHTPLSLSLNLSSKRWEKQHEILYIQNKTGL